MNKWVVLILMALAFAAGTLSMSKMGQVPGDVTAPATPAGPIASTSTTAQPSEPVAAAAPPLRTGAPPQSPKFGLPPRPGASAPNEAVPSRVRGKIKAYVLSSSPDGSARTSFPKSTESVYLTLTPEEMSDRLELVAIYRNALKEDEAFSAPVSSSGPPRRRTFRLTAPENGWAAGPYLVIVKPANSSQELALARFEIEKDDAKSTPTFEPPEYVSLSRSVDEPSSSSVFSADDRQVYLRVSSEGVPSSSNVRSVWSAVEVEKLTPGELVAVSEVPAPGDEQDALFTFAPPKGGFLPGSYRVDIYFDQQQVGTQAFFIQPAETADASASPTP